MKILFFIESLRSGGKERRLVELIKGLSSNPNMEMELVLTKKEIHYQDIFSTKVKIHFVRRKYLKKDPSVFYKFYKIVKQTRPDIIHVWGNLAAIYAIPAKYFLKIPLINSQITNAPSKVSNSILSHKLSFPFSDRIIANSFAGLEAYNSPMKKSEVIYNGFDFNRINNLKDFSSVKDKFNISTKFVVGMVATFSNKKDYESYIKAANQVLSSRTDTTFLCIGSGNMSLYEQMVPIQNKAKILFLGKQENVESIMKICDIGVLSTYTEGISNTLLEFSALGKPVVTNFGGGNVELVEQGVTGFLVNQKSPDELAAKILFFLNNDDERISFGQRGEEKINKMFSFEKMIYKFSQAYEEILKNT